MSQPMYHKAREYQTTHNSFNHGALRICWWWLAKQRDITRRLSRGEWISDDAGFGPDGG